MRVMLIIAALVLSGGQAMAGESYSVRLAALEAIIPGEIESDARTQVAIMCFKTGEQISGMNKICYYDCAGSAAAITVGVAQLCPLTIDR